MSRFQNETTKVIVSVADTKDDRFGDGWLPYTAVEAPKRAPAVRKSTVRKSTTK